MAAPRRTTGHITPTTKGANTSTQRRHTATPWTAPKPRALSEDELYSNPANVPMKSRLGQVRTPEAIAAAAARMNPPDLDALGESDFGLGHGDVNGNGSDNQEQENPDPSLFVPRSEVQGMIDAAMTEFVKLLAPTPAMKAGPAPYEVKAQPQPQSSLVALTVTPEDVDRLWDWIRQSPSLASAFFGIVPATSLQLHRIITALGDAERSGIAILKAIHYQSTNGADEHMGFGMLAPIMGGDKLAVVHLYLSPQRRGALAQMAAALIDLTAQHLPGFKFAIVPTDDAQARLYSQVLIPLGFAQHTMFVR